MDAPTDTDPEPPTSGHRHLGAYSATLLTYGASVAALVLVGVRRGRRPPEVRPFDLLLHGLATFKVARALTKDAVTSPLRAPVTHFEGQADTPGELVETPRYRSGVRRAAGELATCPFCAAQWVGTGFAAGMVLAPQATRLAMNTMAAVAVSDFVQFAYVAADKRV
ncbi:DUF1360 domain-containing protein [Actinomarinicola tropica]|uniref:DUF1360 domain-containing protein n=1 Tax=Actinomarinicola tropica TaxID=2789776 RepID=A0A5Q2RHM8_9ACTN|nr:DUF1360 domain-containing protein [Actinomarinicola tropica]QGG93826.1 DUF1360 domain-containing protein [Actinomarinicola tropica]